jgi:tryptophan-rich sensory protein
MRTSFYKQPHIIAAGVWLLMVIMFGRLLTDIGSWYLALKQPDWKPPDWAFGLIWTTIFLLASFSWHFAWQGSSTKRQKIILSCLFIANGLLNVFWSLLYFQWHRPDWSLIEAIFLWLSVFAIITFTWKLSKLAALFISPYIIWVSLAILLNLETIRLNGPFQ